MKSRKIKKINLIYPHTEDMLQKLYIEYNKNLAKVLIDELPPEVIDMLILNLEYKYRFKKAK